MNKIASGITLTSLFFIGMLTWAFVSQPVTACMHFETGSNPLLAESLDAVIYVDPPVSIADTDETFTIDVKIGKVEDLWDYEFRLQWDPTLLDVTSIAEGPFLNAEGTYSTFFVKKEDFPSVGNLYVVCTLFNEPVSAAASGSGTLATVEFLVLDAGNCTLDLYGTFLHDPEQDKIEHTVEDGFCNYSPTAPVAFFSYSPSAPLVFETVAVDASVSYDPNGTIVRYDWDFGDGTNGTGIIVTHIYTTAGIHPVKLTVTDKDGETDTIIKFINIRKIPPYVSISASCPSTFVGFRVNITGTLCDIYGKSLENETVVLYYTFSGIAEWVPITSDATDHLGNYQVLWIPPATGDYILKAEWSGNATYLRVNSTTSLSSLAYEDQYVFSVESNSTISELAFDTKNWKLSFTATGPNGTRGYVKVTVAKSLVANASDIRVFMDGRQLEYSVTSLDDSWLLTFSYVHSTHEVEINLGAEAEDTTPPVISILFPEHLTWYPESNVSLTFTVDEPTDWIGCSLNDWANVTVPGNTTLSLSDGEYYIVVYANDTSGNMGSSGPIHFMVDTTPPKIVNVSQDPPKANVQPQDTVNVIAVVTDNLSPGLKVTLNYTTNNETWISIPATTNEGSNYSAAIPQFPYCTNVTYIILVEDDAGNTVTSEELGHTTQYHVIPEFPSLLILPLFMIATLLVVLVHRRKHHACPRWLEG